VSDCDREASIMGRPLAHKGVVTPWGEKFRIVRSVLDSIFIIFAVIRALYIVKCQYANSFSGHYID
jgi:hypothetical protein